MCVLFIAKNVSPEYPLVIIANRDEFYTRPTSPMHVWPNDNIIAGQDLQAGGTWLGVSNHGKIAALTNIRDPQNQSQDAISRGELVTNFLRQDQPIAKTKHQLIDSASHYNGYNLLFGDINSLQVFNSATQCFSPIGDGIHGLSNAALNTPWPKIKLGCQLLSTHLHDHATLSVDSLANILANTTIAPDNSLPDTGVPTALERALSPLFIHSEAHQYGTRCTSVILVNKRNKITFYEASYNEHGLLFSTKRQQIRATD